MTERKIAVPYSAQEKDFTCGPACLQMVFRFFGHAAEQAELETFLSPTPEEGASTEKLVEAVVRAGLTVHVTENGTIADIIRAIDIGNPVIVNFIDTLWNEGHFAVAVGYTDTHLILNDPLQPAGLMIEQTEFARRWHSEFEPKVGWMLVVSKE